MTTNRMTMLGAAFLALVTSGIPDAQGRMDMPPITQNQDTFDDDQGTTSGSTGGGGGGGAAPAADPACGSDPGQCFGVVGINCDGAMPPTVVTAITGFADLLGFPVEQIAEGFLGGAEVATTSTFFGCIPNGGCHINSGSWLHDECCAMTTGGTWCSTQNTTLDPNSTAPCTAQWNRAVDRTARGLSWIRNVDRCRVDGDGMVDFNEYCAPGGTIVGVGDDRFCCSGRTRAFSLLRDAGQAAVQHTILFAGPVRVCRGPAAPPATGGAQTSTGGSASAGSSTRGRVCQTNSQCASDERCFQMNGETVKHCVAV
jgi:hypothetical protein